MADNCNHIGVDGEELARAYLVTKGYKIHELNWRFRKYEIDIIAQEGETVVFVEVKTRKNNAYGEPEVFVTKKKQKFLVAAAYQYLEEKQIVRASRFDIIAIINEKHGPVVNHLADAFYPSIK